MKLLKVMVIPLSLILTNCSNKQPELKIVRQKLIECPKLPKFKAVKKTYNYVVKIKDFDKLINSAVKCKKINKLNLAIWRTYEETK